MGLDRTATELKDYPGLARAGRKRRAPITLSVVEFSGRQISEDDHSENPQGDYERYFKARGKPFRPTLIREDDARAEPGWTLKAINDETLAKGEALAPEENAAQIADVFEEALNGLAAAQDRKVSLRTQADPLGIRSGAFKKRPKTPMVGDATYERLAKAKASGSDLITEQETFEDGRPTGLERKRFRGILEVWRDRKTIDEATFAAAETFQRDCDLAISASPRMIARYGHRLPAGIPELLPQEIQVEFEARKRNAIKVVDPRLHFILAWIAEVSNTEVHPDTVAERYWSKLSKDRRMERFKALLDYVCMLLSVHYGQINDKRHRWVELAISKAAQEVYDLLNT